MILGASGFIGYHIYHLLRETNPVFGTYHSHSIDTNLYKVDFLNVISLKKAIHDATPQIIINAAGLTDPSMCELKPDLAQELNTEIINKLKNLVSNGNIKFIQLSTDNVFDGNKGNYSETDQPKPINVYGQTKYQAEMLVRNNFKNFSILRISLVFGKSYSQKASANEAILDTISKGKTYYALTDEYRSPTYVGDVPLVVKKLIKRGINGIFHISSNRKLSRYEFAQKVLELYGYSMDNLKPICSKDFQCAYNRPSDTTLNTEKTRDVLNMEFRGISNETLSGKEY